MTICFLFSFLTFAYADINTGLVGWWRFDEASGNAVDSSGQSNTGTPTGTIIFSNCKRSGCRSFNGTSDYVDAGNNASLNITSPVTVACWVYANSITVGNRPTILIKGYDGGTTREGYALGINIIGGGPSEGLNTLNFLTYSAGIGVSGSYSTASIPIGQWVHVAGIFDGTIWSTYINGAQDRNSNGTQTQAPFTTPENVFIGAANADGVASRFWSGKIDDVRIYTRALTAQEVHDLYIPGAVLRGAVLRGLKVNQ